MQRGDGVVWPDQPKTNFKVRKESFTLNKIKALQNKQKAGCRPEDLDLVYTGGGLVLTFSAAYYEAFRHVLGQSNYTIHRNDTDETGEATVREVLKIVNKSSSKLYTINLFPTKSRALVNGSAKHLSEQFLSKDLPFIVKIIDEAFSSMAINTDTLNNYIVQCIDKCLSGIKSGKSESHRENPENSSHLMAIAPPVQISGDISCKSSSLVPTDGSQVIEAHKGPNSEQTENNILDDEDDDPNLSFESVSDSSTIPTSGSSTQTKSADTQTVEQSQQKADNSTETTDLVYTQCQGVQTERITIDNATQTDHQPKDEQSKENLGSKVNLNNQKNSKSKSSEGIHCLSKGCKFNRHEKKDEDMIMCGACFKWYHYKCTIDSRETLEKCVVYTCQDCRLLAAKVDDLLQHMQAVTTQLKGMSSLPSTAQSFLSKSQNLDSNLKGYKQSILDVATNVSNIHDALSVIEDQQQHTRADVLEVSVQVESIAQGITDLKKSVKQIETNQKKILPSYSEITGRTQRNTDDHTTRNRETNTHMRHSPRSRTTNRDDNSPRERFTEQQSENSNRHRRYTRRSPVYRRDRPHSYSNRDTEDRYPQRQEHSKHSERNRHYNPRSHSPGLTRNHPRCWNCNEIGHVKRTCYYDSPLQCNNCFAYGHKIKHCHF